MFKFGIKNLRRLQNIEPIELKPITILVGRNSSGKSTFLRSFPLIRQSLMTRISSPVLWYGDLVDFGSYLTSVSDNKDTTNISFVFFSENMISETGRFWPHRSSRDADTPLSRYKNMTYEVALGLFEKRTVAKHIKLSFESPKISYEFDIDDTGKVSTIKFNGIELQGKLGKTELIFDTGSIFPELHIKTKSIPKSTFRTSFRTGVSEILIDPLFDLVKPVVPKTLINNLEYYVALLVTIGPLSDKEIIEFIEKSDTKGWTRFVEEVLTTDKRKIKDEFVKTIALCSLIVLVNNAAKTFSGIISKTLYIGPARARSERYYRYQELAVSEIDPDGKNFPMFLNSLTKRQLLSLSDSIKSLFGYGLSVSRTEGHISINLLEEDMGDTNIVDAGYGLSQIMPVLAQIWWARERPLSRSLFSMTNAPSILAIEQPELHLHPAHQALLADAIAGQPLVARPTAPSGQFIHFLVETHSETMINRFGELIAEGKVKPEDIQVILFQPDPYERHTTTSISTFDDNGALLNWPYGFFQPPVVF